MTSTVDTPLRTPPQFPTPAGAQHSERHLNARPRPTLADGLDEALAQLVPEHICRSFHLLPYAEQGGLLFIAAVDEMDPTAELLLTQHVEQPISLVAHDPAAIAAALDEVYPRLLGDEAVVDRVARAEMSQILLHSKLVDHEQLRLAVAEYARTGDSVGDILVANGVITEDVLVAALAEMYEMPRVSLVGLDVDLTLSRRLPEVLARTLQAIPLAEADGTVYLAVARPLSPEARQGVETAIGSPVAQLLANRTDLDLLLQRVHAAHYSRVSTHALMDERPEASGHIVATKAQKSTFIAMAVAVLGCAVIWPATTAIVVVGLCSLAYLVASGYKFQLSMRALGTHLEADISDEDLAALDERTLPIYTIFVPVYKEAGIMRRLVRDLNKLDYPKTRLDIKILCEEDDVETVAMLHSMHLAPHFHVVVVPDSLPKTKPKACNYGLQLATGHYSVIFDAEDRPDPDQLKKAVIAFRRANANVACVQGKLNHFNGDQNLLTAWFANEYSMHFELVLPAMGASESPIPLGGTSNHFKTDILRDLGAWDPFNVTEDADLGIRLHREGYRTAMIDSTTLEEANPVVPNWIRQRSRWNKGYIQTWLVHMRRPLQLLREVGLKDFLSFNLTMGSTFLLLMNPIFWTLTTMFVLTQAGFIQDLFPGLIYYAASAMLFVGNFVFVYINVAGSLQRGEFRLTRTALLTPLYWGLMSWAAWKGFIQLFTNPFYWEKTEHGLDEEDH